MDEMSGESMARLQNRKIATKLNTSRNDIGMSHAIRLFLSLFMTSLGELQDREAISFFAAVPWSSCKASGK